jgi:hypothetical protein
MVEYRPASFPQCVPTTRPNLCYFFYGAANTAFTRGSLNLRVCELRTSKRCLMTRSGEDKTCELELLKFTLFGPEWVSACKLCIAPEMVAIYRSIAGGLSPDDKAEIDRHIDNILAPLKIRLDSD